MMSFWKKPFSKKPQVDAGGDHGAFLDSLNKALSGNPTVSTGRVHLIGMEKIKDMLGDDWERLKNKAHHIVRSAIEERLGPQDVCTLYEDLSYLVVFAALSKEEAQLKCSMIAQEITGRLIGRQTASNFTDVSTLALKEDGKVYFEKLPSIGRLAEQLKKEVVKTKRENAAPAPPKPKAGGKKEDIDWSRIRLVFRPLWYVRHEMVTTFLSVPVMETGNGAFVYGYDLLRDPCDPEGIARLDSHVLHIASKELKRIAMEGKKALLSVPVHFETLASGQRKLDFINLCNGLLAGHDDRMVFELVELPDGIPQSRIVELVSALRAHARAVTARFSLDHRNFMAYRIAGLHAAGTDIFSDKRKEADIMREMNGFVEAANNQNLKTYIHGVRTLSMKTAAIASGFDYIDGYALTSVADAPDGAYSLGLEQSYRPLLDWKDHGE
ncbi:MAG: hypothetical protein A3G18_04810 [Rhodospirillales bacterium RIFCSPLOWO2_12_FULL_58_28]|nr:MAG: hypothetical protein A3H92_12580 [Rhodospirillales bacterium RIFCSPLOWO2_02_FULL_58_16]OHC79453.1 MAG: hypothetical protein A3G18_04810 [Rhodospirillales bacterium RIFCSPLOWO2_12_FULL_58_28]